MRRRRGKSVRRRPAERFVRAVKELLIGWAGGLVLIASIGMLAPGEYRAAQASLAWSLAFSPLGMLMVLKVLLMRMQEGRGMREAIDAMQRRARVSVLYLPDLTALTDGSFEVDRAGAPFEAEDLRALRRRGAFMFLCTACAVCDEDENAAFARAFGFEQRKLCSQFPLQERTVDAEGVVRSTHLENGAERTFLRGSMDAILALCQAIWDEASRPMTDEDRLTLKKEAASAASQGLRVAAFGMSEGGSNVFLGYTAARAVLRAEACAQVKALLANGVRTSLLLAPDSSQARALARRAGVACPSGRGGAPGVRLRTAAVLGEAQAGCAEVAFAREGGLDGALQEIAKARHRLCTLVEAARSAGKASAVLGALVLAAYLARFTVLWPFAPGVLGIFAAIAAYYIRRC